MITLLRLLKNDISALVLPIKGYLKVPKLRGPSLEGLLNFGTSR